MILLSKNGNPLKSIGFKKAIELMRRPEVRLIRAASCEGFTHYIVPGGYVDPGVAEKIKAHPQVSCGEDGLWPGHAQTWRLMGLTSAQHQETT